MVIRVACPQKVGGKSTFALKISMGGSFLEKEIEKSAAFKHDYFIHVLGAESKKGLNILAMEEAKGSLMDIITKISPSLPKTRHFEQLLDQVGSCVSTITKTLVHRDIKPSNILIFHPSPPTQGFYFKLTDLGIAISLEHKSASTTTATALGTNLYLSERFQIAMREGDDLTKEQLLREDSFNLGVTLLQYVCSLTEEELMAVRFE